MDSKSFRVLQIRFWSAESLVGCAEFQSKALKEISSGLKAYLVGPKVFFDTHTRFQGNATSMLPANGAQTRNRQRRSPR